MNTETKPCVNYPCRHRSSLSPNSCRTSSTNQGYPASCPDYMTDKTVTAYTPPEIDMIPVESSSIESVGHDGAETLRVKFLTSGAYDYQGITEAEFFDLVNSPSVGKAYNALTRARGIKGVKLSQEVK